MSDSQSKPATPEADTSAKGPLLYFLAVVLVFVGLLNSIPGIPGFDNAVKEISGLDWLTLRKYPREWFFPIVFSGMMIIVTLKHSMWRSWKDRSVMRRRFGLIMDVLLVVAALGVSLTYLVEFEAICLVDRFTGERERLIAQSLRNA